MEDQGNPKNFLVHREKVIHTAVVEELLSMIRCDDDQRLFEEPLFFKQGKKAAQLVVQLTDSCVIEFLEMSNVILIEFYGFEGVIDGEEILGGSYTAFLRVVVLPAHIEVVFFETCPGDLPRRSVGLPRVGADKKSLIFGEGRVVGVDIVVVDEKKQRSLLVFGEPLDGLIGDPCVGPSTILGVVHEEILLEISCDSVSISLEPSRVHDRRRPVSGCAQNVGQGRYLLWKGGVKGEYPVAEGV